MNMLQGLSCSVDVIKSITPAEVLNIIRGDKKGDYIILDVRTVAEYEDGHLPGAVFIPVNELDYRLNEFDRQKKIISYCRSGKRSIAGAIILCNYGFLDLYNMEGGILGWPYEKIKGPPDEAEEIFKDKRDIKDILLLALEMERSLHVFYHKATFKVKSDDVRNLLRKLSDIEEKHCQILYEQLKEEWPGAPSLEKIEGLDLIEGAISFSQTFLDFDIEPPRETIDVLELALEIESKAFDLYSRMSTRVVSPLKSVFRDLAGMEREHINELYKHF